jgi:hypothetical protein
MPVQRLKVTFLLLDLTCSVVTHSGGNYSDWRVSHAQAGRNIRKRRLGNEKGITV